MGTISQLKEIKKGLVVIYNNEPCLIVSASFLRMQARKPVMQTKMKSLSAGKTYEYSFKQGESVETADLSRTKADYLYKDNTGYVFMNNETYDQVSIDEETLGDQKNYIKEGLTVDLLYWDEKLVSIGLPPKVDLLVTETEPGAKGDTAQGGGTKPATLESGYTLQVPIFIKRDDVLKINTDTGSYDSRVSE